MAITLDGFPLLESAPARLSRGVLSRGGRRMADATTGHTMPPLPAGMSWVVSRSAATGRPGAYLYTEYGAEAERGNADSWWFRAVSAPRMVRKAARITAYVKRMESTEQ
jgi:hypothetical protein